MIGSMELRRFGATDLRVSELGLGCARIGGVFQRDPKGFLDLLRAAYDGGINFFDTADMYSQGESETLLGRAFYGRRDRVVIASKAGYKLPAQRRLAAHVKPLLRPLIRALGLRRDRLPGAVRGEPTQDFSPSYLRGAVEGSLRRLRTDYLDLFQLHSPPAEIVRRGEWETALEVLKREGKIRYFGISCDTADAALAAVALPEVSSVQLAINLLERSAAERVLPQARAAQVAMIARECLANGLLAKDAGAVDLKTYCRSPEEAERRARQLEAARKLAQESGCSLAQLALRFVQGLEGVSVALIGVSTQAQLTELLRLRRDGPELPAAAFRAVPA
jgi:aryl-alcohol dehydrogenase-like predicted oxidoreductase